MSEGGLKFGFKIFFGVIFGVLAAVFVEFLIPAAYFTAQTETFSILWVGSFAALVAAVAVAIGILLCANE